MQTANAARDCDIAPPRKLFEAQPALITAVHGHLAHQKTPLPPRTTVGPQAYPDCRVLGGGGFV